VRNRRDPTRSTPGAKAGALAYDAGGKSWSFGLRRGGKSWSFRLRRRGKSWGFRLGLQYRDHAPIHIDRLTVNEV
jgi:hypothetical protein